MKKVLESMAFAALAVFAAACAKESNVEQEKGTKELHFVVKTAANAPVKSYLENEYDGTYTPKWSKGDAMAIFIGDITSSTKKATATLYNTSDNQSVATFEGNVNVAGEGYFKGITPAERFTNGLSPEENGECVAVNLGDSETEYVQRPTNKTIDESCDILVSKPTYYYSDGNEALIDDDVYFKRIMSVVKVVVKGPESLKAEKIHSLKLTSSDATLSGRAKVDVTNAKVVSWTVPSKSLSAVYSDESEMPVVYDADNVLNTVFYVANPTTLESGTTLTVSGETDNYTISKEITLQNNIVFPESQIAVINLSLDELNFVAKTSGSTYALYEDELEDGDYLIVYEGRAMKALVSSGRLSYASVTAEDNQIETTDNSIVWHIAQSGEYWTIYNEEEKQYAASTGAKNKAQLLADGTDDKSLWTVSISKEKTFEFVNKANAANANLRGNGDYGFACYSTSTGGALSLYRLAGPVVPKYEIVCTEVAEGGTISASAAKAAEGKEITLTATPETGYVFDGWSVKDEGGNEITVADDKFTMPAAKVIVSGSFSKIEYKITKADAVGGSFTVKVNGVEAVAAYYKDEVSLEATAEEGYDFSSWTVTYTDGTTDKTISTKGVFTMPAADVTVKATFTEKAKIPVYASLAELVAAGAPTSTEQFVTVTLSDEVITKLYVVGQYTNGVYFNVGSQEVLIYCKDTPTDWKVGGSVSGTLTNCKWVLFNNKTWELCPDDYSELTCVSPCETPVITLNGAEATITCATEGATIHYTVDGTDPTTASPVYTASVTLTDGQTIKAIAVKDGMKDSAVASKKYGEEEAVFDYSKLYSSVTETTKDLNNASDEVDGVSISYKKVSGNNSPKYYKNGTNLRIYNESSMTISAPAGRKLLSVDFSQGTTTWANKKMSADLGTVNDSDKKWTADDTSSSSSVVFTVTGSFRFTKIVVKYE